MRTTTAREAASAILVRRRDDSLEVLLVRRDPSASFLPGLTAFPGGAVDDGDRAASASAPDPADAAARRAAMRELFEETGLVAGAADHEDAAAAARDAWLDHRNDEAAALLATRGMRLHPDRGRPAGRWITPEYSPIRFDTRFYLVEARHDEGWPEPSLVGHELDKVAWWRPSDALAAWGRAEHLIGPPAVIALRALARCENDPEPDLDAAARAMRETRGADGRQSQRWEVVPGVFAMPFRTPTLPPATHTNAYVLGSGSGAVLVEPATPFEDEQDRMVDWLAELRDGGVEVREMWLTHHHPDHVGGATALARRLGLPLRAHRVTVDRLRGTVACNGTIEPDEVVELDGPHPVRVRAFFTPGHAPGHLCYFEERSGALLAGDMVASIGTILVAPGDGDMALYLESLRAMGRLGPTVLLPAHGFPVGDPHQKLEGYVAHRLMRERKVLDALDRASSRGTRDATYADLLPIAYEDTPKAVWPLAALSLQSHLLKLQHDGRASRHGDAWRLTASSA
ncbi:MAG: MBL fold metallo-hydrolase [Deltaproteobacteria bacterium]|nr:MBL fold metallo-hydrolase [Deltaproteobacteria bacterium]